MTGNFLFGRFKKSSQDGAKEITDDAYYASDDSVRSLGAQEAVDLCQMDKSAASDL
jgi:hypothetical protein